MAAFDTDGNKKLDKKEFREVRLTPLMRDSTVLLKLTLLQWQGEHSTVLYLKMSSRSRTVCPHPHQDGPGRLLLEGWPEHGHQHGRAPRGRLGTEEGSKRYAPRGHKPGKRQRPHSSCGLRSPVPALVYTRSALDALAEIRLPI